MNEFTQFIWAMWDSTQAALVSLNPVPVLIFGLFIGMVQPRRASPWLMALFALVPAVIVTALLPQVLGYRAIWPDLSQLEAEFQMVILLAIAYVVVRVMALIRNALSPARV